MIEWEAVRGLLFRVAFGALCVGAGAASYAVATEMTWWAAAPWIAFSVLALTNFALLYERLTTRWATALLEKSNQRAAEWQEIVRELERQRDDMAARFRKSEAELAEAREALRRYKRKLDA